MSFLPLLSCCLLLLANAANQVGAQASEDDLRRSVCYIDGWLFPRIKDFALCYERAEEYDEADAFFEDQVFNGEEWVPAIEIIDFCFDLGPNSGQRCQAKAVEVEAASPTAGSTRAFSQPPPTRRCDRDNNLMWKRIRGRLRCVSTNGRNN